jgi:hypothetical protein
MMHLEEQPIHHGQAFSAIPFAAAFTAGSFDYQVLPGFAQQFSSGSRDLLTLSRLLPHQEGQAFFDECLANRDNRLEPVAHYPNQRVPQQISETRPIFRLVAAFENPSLSKWVEFEVNGYEDRRNEMKQTSPYLFAGCGKHTFAFDFAELSS